MLMIKKVSVLTFLFALLAAAVVSAQTGSSVLKPPKGAQVAIVVFEDLQCPDCRRAAPLLEEASKTYNIPIVRHDFPLPFHSWSFDAALIARYFDKTSRKTGNEFRDYPFVVDPKGELAAKITADKNLGVGVGIQHTPTIYVVSNKTQGKPFVEVVDRSKLFELIDTMKRE